MATLSHKTRAHGLLLALALVFPAAPSHAEQASPSDVRRLLEVMDMEHMLSGMMRQVSSSQQALVEEAFGAELTDQDRARMQDLAARAQAKVQERMSWPALEPIMARVYAQVFSKEEIEAMVAFYGSPTGASILRKSPQAMALSMQEMQPLMQQLMQDLRQDLHETLGAGKP